MPRRNGGVSALELLGVLTMIGLLALIAVPGYQRHVMRMQRSDAIIALTRLQAAQHKHFLQYGGYVTLTADLPRAPGDGGLGISNTSELGLYDLSVMATATGYTASATASPSHSQADDINCANISISESGIRRALSRSGAERTAECFG